MNRRTFVQSLGSSYLAARSAPAPAATASPFDVGSTAQLFVDRALVRRAEQVSFTLHPAAKHAGNPLLRPDRPWEGWQLELYGNVLYDPDEQMFKMWYYADCPGCFAEHDSPSLYATSADGVKWEKPLVGTIPSLQGGKHNAVVLAELASVMKDRDDPDPAQRYKMICFLSMPREIQGYH